MDKILSLVGRIMLAVIFIWSGLGKLVEPSMAAGAIAAKGLPASHALAILCGLIELAGGLLVLFGFLTHWASLILFLYMIPVTFVVHDFWVANGPARTTQEINFMKNLAIMGGLLTLFEAGPGSLSLDRRRHSIWHR